LAISFLIESLIASFLFFSFLSKTQNSFFSEDGALGVCISAPGLKQLTFIQTD
jgi:hypothetical protein